MAQVVLAATALVPLAQLHPAPWNPRTLRDSRFRQLCASLTADPDFLWERPILAQADGTIYAGNMRYRAAEHLGWAEIPARVGAVSEQQAKARALRDNNSYGEWQDQELAEMLVELRMADVALETLGFADEDLTRLLDSVGALGDTPTSALEPTVSVERASLADRFLVPPFSVLDARQGYWQTRKRAWLALGIQSELGRGDATTPGSDGDRRPGRAGGEYDGGHAWLNGGRKDAGLLGEAEQARSHYRNAAPGGSLQDATSIKGGHTQRGDGAGRPLAPASGLARCFGQDLMRGEHVVGQGAAPSIGTGGPGTMDAQRKEWRQADNRAIKDHAWLATHGQSHPQAGRTWVGGAREWDELDETSRKNLAAQPQSGTSIFDPVLCELAYRWWCPPDGAVLDPFAGGSVRGIVAALLGRRYTGIDLSERQLEANRVQAATITPEAPPTWVVGDSGDVATLVPGTYDLVFSCPPYADLERYSDDPRDLSTLAYADFLTAYRAIIGACVALLAPDRFACFVVGDVRDRHGFYRNFVSDTIAAFQAAGAMLYNEAILVTAVGSLPIRVGRQFESGRKLGKTHQNVLVFCKGDPKRATIACGPVEISWPDDLEGIEGDDWAVGGVDDA